MFTLNKSKIFEGIKLWKNLCSNVKCIFCNAILMMESHIKGIKSNKVYLKNFLTNVFKFHFGTFYDEIKFYFQKKILEHKKSFHFLHFS